MADPRNTDPNRPSRTPDARPRRSPTGLIIAAIIAILVLIGFIFWDSSGFQEPPADAVAPEGESPQTEAPSQTEPVEPGITQDAPQPAPAQ